MTSKSVAKKSTASRKRAPAQEFSVNSVIDEARRFISAKSRSERTAIAAGAIGFVAMAMTKTGRGVLRRVGGFALPIAISALEPVVQEIISKKFGEKISNQQS